MRRAHPSLPFAIIIIIIGVSYCDNELKSHFQRLLRKQKKAKKVQASMLLTAQESNFANGTKSDPHFVFNNLFNCLHFLPSSSYRLRAQRAVRFSRDEVWSGFHRSTTTQLCRFSLNPQRPVRRLSNERWEIVQKFVRKFEKFTQHEFAPSRSKKIRSAQLWITTFRCSTPETINWAKRTSCGFPFDSVRSRKKSSFYGTHAIEMRGASKPFFNICILAFASRKVTFAVPHTFNRRSIIWLLGDLLLPVLADVRWWERSKLAWRRSCCCVGTCCCCFSFLGVKPNEFLKEQK